MYNKEDILNKTNKLKETNIQLKKEFIGIDDVIDNLCNLIESWYFFPDIQFRPTIINLWGLTGVGKTSLIKRTFEILEIESTYFIDIGDWIKDDSPTYLKDNLTYQFRNIKDKNRPIFVLDEFQLGRSIDNNGDDVEKPALRIIWDLFDTGKISIFGKEWITDNLTKLYNKLEYCIKNGVKVKDGNIKANNDIHKKLFSVKYDEFSDIEKELYGSNPFIPNDSFWTLMDVFEDDFKTELELSKHIKKLSNENSILQFIKEGIDKSYTPKNYDFKDSLIFVIGNLDDAYRIYDDANPEMDADILYEHTKKITLTNIKSSLLKLFRPEQISRLGNNHLIYKSLNSKMYKDIINLELSKLNDIYKNKFNLNLIFDETITDIIFKDGVFPAQGVRPLFSTIKNIIESSLSKVISEIYKNNWTVNEIKFNYNNKNINIEFDNNEKLSYPTELKIEQLRESDNSDKQALVAIHETGHILTSIFALKLCPKIAVSRTANLSEGYTVIDYPDNESYKLLFNRVVVLLGGYAAEKMVFGKKNISNGTQSDFINATNTLINMVKSFGMGDLPLIYKHDTFSVDDMPALDIKSTDSNDKIIDDLLKKALKKTNKILKSNKKLLFKIGEYLSHNSRIDEKTIKKFVKKYSKQEPNYRTKDNYFDYKKIIKNKLK